MGECLLQFSNLSMSPKGISKFGQALDWGKIGRNFILQVQLLLPPLRLAAHYTKSKQFSPNLF